MGKGRPLWFTLICCVLVTSVALLVPSTLRFRRHTIRTASPTGDIGSSEPSVLDRPVTITTSVGSENEPVIYRPEAADQNNVHGGSGIVIIAGFENFNIQLYRKAAALVTSNVPSVPVSVFTDADIAERPGIRLPVLHIHPPYQHTLSTHSINKPVNLLYQCTLSTHPIKPLHRQHSMNTIISPCLSLTLPPNDWQQTRWNERSVRPRSCSAPSSWTSYRSDKYVPAAVGPVK